MRAAARSADNPIHSQLNVSRFSPNSRYACILATIAILAFTALVELRGFPTVAALYGAVKKILRLDRKWTGDNGRSPCAVAQGDRPNGRSLGTVGRGPGGIGSGGVGVDTDQIGRRAEEAI